MVENYFLLIFFPYRHCYDSISVQGEFGLNLTENDSYDHVNKDFIPILNVKSNNQNEVKNLVYSSQNGIILVYFNNNIIVYD